MSRSRHLFPSRSQYLLGQGDTSTSLYHTFRQPPNTKAVDSSTATTRTKTWACTSRWRVQVTLKKSSGKALLWKTAATSGEV